MGAAAGAALLATVLSAGVAVEDQSLQRGLAQTAEGERAVRVVWGGIPTGPQERFPTLNREARSALSEGAGHQVADGFMLYREWRIRGDLVDLGAADHLNRWLRLRAGRFPRECRPERCEVVQLAGTGPLAQAPGLHLVRVGTGSLISSAPFGDLVGADTSTSILAYSQRYHRPAKPPFVLAEGVSALSRIRYLEDDYRSYAWLVPLHAGSVHPWSLGRLLRGIAAARSTLAARSRLFSLTAPEPELRAAEQTGRVGSRRLLLLGGEAAALLLAFSVLTASGLRREAEIGRRRLTWLGARRWQLALESICEAVGIAAAGTAIGWFAGAVPAALVARDLGSEAGGVLAHSVLAPAGLVVALVVAGAAALVLLAALSAPPLRLGGISLSLLDVAALGAAAVVAVILVRGPTDPVALAEANGTGTALLILPGLLAFVAAVLAARLVTVLPRLLERLARRGPVPSRLALLSLARSPGRAAAAVSFLVVSLGLALFASVYRSTLVRGQHDQAAFAFPRRVLVSEDYSQLVPALAAAPLERYEQLGDAIGVLRSSGNVPGLEPGGFTLLGVPDQAIAGLDGWRYDFSGDSLRALAQKVDPPGPTALRGVSIPADARRLDLPAQVDANVGVRAQIARPDGTFAALPLLPNGRRLSARLPATERGGRVIAFVFEPRNTRLSLGANSVRGGAPAGKGTIVLGQGLTTGPSGTRTFRLDYSRWTGEGGVRSRTSRTRAELRLLVTPELEARFRLRQPLDGRAVPVVASPRLAAATGTGGLLPVDIEGRRLLTRVVGSADRFPATEGDFVFGDREALETALNSARPGSAITNEVWIDPQADESEQALTATLRRPPFDVLDIRSRQELEQRLAGDPLARGSLLALTAAAAVSLALALAGLLLEVFAELQDERGELFDLEAQGATPRVLRLRLRLRSAFVAVLGLLGGLATGAVLSALVVDLVRVTANATSPEPSLVPAPGWGLLAIGIAAYTALSVGLVVWVTGRAFRGSSAGRVAEAGW